MITSRCYNMLAKVRKNHNHIDSDALSWDELSICNYLCDLRCLQRTDLHESHPDEPIIFTITEEGRTQMELRETEIRHWWFPVVISILSLIISVIALTK